MWASRPERMSQTERLYVCGGGTCPIDALVVVPLFWCEVIKQRVFPVKLEGRGRGELP
jgi:hypothetical protein